MAIQVGKEISHYKIIGRLGEGGMGEIYKAEDIKLKRTVALKFLPPSFSSDKDAKQRLIHEAQSASALDHPNICTIFEIGETDDEHLFISMALYEGETLKDKIAKGPISFDETIKITRQVCEGLEKAHKNEIIHRDIKPANLFITTDGVVKILDFGLAKGKGQTQLTKMGSTVGTVDYMSPEQTRGDNVDKRTDIWSLGVVIYEMLTGQLPFRGDYEQAVIYSILNEVPKPLSNLKSNIPIGLEELISKMLNKEMINRYSSIGELLTDLNSLDLKIKDQRKEISFKEKKWQPSIAVLPFKDMSSQHDQDYLCEGFAEEMINTLAHIDGLKVAARTSSFSFKGKDEDIRSIGEKLNVNTLLEGSVQKSGKQLRVTVQLINVSDGYHLWSERFDRNVKDVFAVQDEISMSIVEKLKVNLLEGEKEKLTKRHTLNEKAYELYLKGRYHWNSRTPKGMVMAVDFFQRAIDIDKNFALSYVGIADVFHMLTEFCFIEPKGGYMKSKALLQKAMELDNSLGEIYSSMALITYCYEWDLPAAERYAYKGIELNPQSFFAHGCRAEILGTQGKYKEAIEEVQKGIELEPLDSLAYALYGILLSGMGRMEEAREQFYKSLTMEPDNPMVLCWLGMVYLAKPADLKKAIESLQKSADAGITLALGFLGMAFALTSNKEEAFKIIQKLNNTEKEPFFPFPAKLILYLKPGLRHFRSLKKKYSPHFLRGFIYLGLNMLEETLNEFEKSSMARDYLLPAQFRILEHWDLPLLDEIFSSQKFKTLRAKIKYT